MTTPRKDCKNCVQISSMVMLCDYWGEYIAKCVACGGLHCRPDCEGLELKKPVQKGWTLPVYFKNFS